MHRPLTVMLTVVLIVAASTWRSSTAGTDASGAASNPASRAASAPSSVLAMLEKARTMQFMQEVTFSMQGQSIHTRSKVMMKSSGATGKPGSMHSAGKIRVETWKITQPEKSSVEATAARRAEPAKSPGLVPDSITIVDMPSGKVLMLMPLSKQAYEIAIGQTAKQESAQETLGQIKDALAGETTALGEKNVLGRRLEGLRAAHGDVSVEVWYDLHTFAPVEMDLAGASGLKTHITDIRLNQDISDLNFRMVVPKDFQLTKQEMDASNLSEKDLQQGMKAAAEVNGGTFPADAGATPEFVDKLLDKSLSSENGEQLTKTLFRMISFLNASQEYKFVGSGVKLGEARSEVVRWRMPSSSTWRVMYGDLSIKDVSAEKQPTSLRSPGFVAP